MHVHVNIVYMCMHDCFLFQHAPAHPGSLPGLRSSQRTSQRACASGMSPAVGGHRDGHVRSSRAVQACSLVRYCYCCTSSTLAGSEGDWSTSGGASSKLDSFVPLLVVRVSWGAVGRPVRLFTNNLVPATCTGSSVSVFLFIISIRAGVVYV